MSGISDKTNVCLAEQEEDCPVGLDGHVEAFFARNGFDGRATRQECDKYARLLFPDVVDTSPSRPQGYCSYTLALSDGYLLQFRPEAFKLNMDMCSDAKAVFGRFAPATTYMGIVQGIPLADKNSDGDSQGIAVEWPVLRVYLQERLPGIPLSEFRKRRRGGSERDAKLCRRRLVEDLAQVFALSFHGQRFQKDDGAIPKGKVGESLRWRLNLLQGLPGVHLARHVSEAQQRLESIERSPWCLTHGDLLPANMMVDPSSGHLTGLIDWAEAEWLPFGMALYGIEEALGQDEPPQGFQYCKDHLGLRRLFWKRFLVFSRRRRQLRDRGSSEGSSEGSNGAEHWLEEMELSRRLGILLWRGIAFDDGRMDRVVEAGRDDSELQRLELFLEGPSPLGQEEEEEEEEGAGGCLALGRVWKWTKTRVVRLLCVDRGARRTLDHGA